MDGFMIARLAAAGVGMGLARGFLQWRASARLKKRERGSGEEISPNLRIVDQSVSSGTERSYALEQGGSQKLLPPPRSEQA
jgi:hypothetical protein